MWNSLKTMWIIFLHMFRRRVTIQYPDEKPYIPPRWRGRIILSRDPDGEERCVACYLCAAACPVDCIALQATEDEHGRRYPDFSESIFHAAFSAATVKRLVLPTQSSSRSDFEMGEYDRKNLVYEKEDLLIDGPGKYPGYNFYRVAGLAIGGKEGKNKGDAENEAPPVDLHRLLP